MYLKTNTTATHWQRWNGGKVYLQYQKNSTTREYTGSIARITKCFALSYQGLLWNSIYQLHGIRVLAIHHKKALVGVV